MASFAGPLRDLTLACAGYAIGCISPGYFLVRFRSGQDIRTVSSGSTGGSNVARVLGWRGYMATALADAAKGGIAVWAALYFGLSAWGKVGVFIAVVAGHIWPAQLGFHGGKGLATGIGALAVYDFQLAVILGGIALLGPVLRLGTVSFLAAAAISPAIAAVLGRPGIELAGLGIVVLLILYAHRDNIRAFLSERRGRKGLQA